MAVFTCPRCEMGQLDSASGKLTVCWYCSSYKPCYVCVAIPGHANSTGCGMAICADDLKKILAAKSAPAKKAEFTPGNPEEDAL
jgi:hypothetical protein